MRDHPRTVPEIEAHVRRVLAGNFCLDPRGITRETRLMEDLGADSLDMVEMVMLVEEEYGLAPVADEDALHWLTVGAIIDYLIPRLVEETDDDLTEEHDA